MAAGNNIVIGLSADSSKVSSVLKSTSKELSSFLGVDRYIKLQLDDTDFRKKYQDDIRIAREELKKLKLETYTAANGKEVKITSKNAVKARDRFIDLANEANKQNNKRLESSYIDKANAVTKYANALYALNIAEKANATLQEKQLGLESRMQAAENTGRVNAKRRIAEAKAMKEALAEVNAEDIKRVNSQITQAQNRLSNARHMKDEVESLRGQIAANRELNNLYRQRAKLSGIDRDKDIALSYGSANRVANDELQRVLALRREQTKLDAERRRSDELRNRSAEQYARINRQIAQEKIKNRLRGGDDANSISKQIALFNNLAAAAKKAGDAKTQAFAKKNISNLEQQYNQILKINGGYERQFNALGRLKYLAMRYFSIYSVINFAKQIATTTGYFQQQQVALEGILKSASKARTVLNEIKDFALQSPFQTKELVSFTKQLSAFGIEDTELFPTVKRLADISAGLGVDMGRIILAYGQVKSAAVLRGQELRQFTEAGIPMVKALADKFTLLNGKLTTTADVFKLISDRKVPFEMVASVLEDMTKEGGNFYKMQENITETTYGQIQKMKDLWTITLDQIGKDAGGLINKVIKGIQNIIINIKPLASFAAFTVIGRGIGKTIEGVAVLIRSLKTLKRSFLAFGALKGAITGWATAIAAVGGLIVGLIAKAGQKERELRNKMNELANGFNKDTNKMVDGLDSLTKKITSANVGTKKFSDAVSTLAQNYGQYLNSDIIKALQGTGTEAQNVADKFYLIADAIKAAIRAQNEYNILQGQKDILSEEAGKNTYEWLKNNQGDILKQKIQTIKGANGGIYTDYEYKTIPGIEDFIKKNPGVTEESLNKSISGIIQRVIEENAKNGTKFEKLYLKTIDQNGNLIEESKLYQGIKGSYDLDDATIRTIIKNVIPAIDKENYQKALSTISTSKSQEYGKLMEPYNQLETKIVEGNITGWKDAIDKEIILSKQWMQAANKSLLAANIDGYNGSKLQTLLTADKFDQNTMAGIADELEIFRNTFDPKKQAATLGRIKMATDPLFNNTTVRRDGAARVFGQFITKGTNLYNSRFDKDLADLAITYGLPNAGTFEQLRNQLPGAESTEKGNYDNHANAADKALAEKRLKFIQELKEVQNYDNQQVKGNKGGGSKGNWAQFLNGFTDLIKNAYNSEKKLVEGADGYTNQLLSDIDKLKDSPLKDFYGKGNPFEKYLQTIQDFDLEGFFKKGDFDKLTTKFMEGVGPDNIATADYKAIWKDLIKIMSDKISATTNPADKERLKSVLRTMTAEYTKFFGTDEIEALVANAIKELVDINKSIENISNQNKIFEEFAPLIGYRQASIAAKGKDYSTFNPRILAEGNLRSLMNNPMTSGFAASEPGAILKNIMDSTSINLQNLADLNSALTAIDKEIQKRSLAAKGDDKATQEVEQFKGIADLFRTAINNMVTAIKDKTTEIVNAMSEEERAALNVDAALRAYQDRLKQISEGKDENGTEVRFKERAQIEATQTLYDTIAKNIGGPAINQYIKDVFGSSKTSTGVTAGGMAMQYIFGGMSFEDIVKTALTTDLADYVKSETERIDKIIDPEEKAKALEGLNNATVIASKGLQKFSGIIGLIQSIAGIAAKYFEGIFDIIDKEMDYLDSYSFLTKDENGNYKNVFSDYTSKTRAENNVAREFVSDFMGLKALSEGDILGVLTAPFNAIMGLIENINKLKDREVQTEQDKLISSNKALARSMDDLTFALEDTAGKDKFDNKYQQIANLQSQQMNYEQLLALEESKKAGDPEKAEEYRQAAKDAKNQQESMLREIQNEIFGFADEVAATLTDAFTEAFRNGTNAARAWRDSVKSYISDILKEQLLQNVVAPKIKSVLDSFGINDGASSESIISALSNPEKVKGLMNELNKEGDGLVNTLNALPQEIQDLIGYKQTDTRLSGGIESITEDTARRLEALQNSQLGETILIRLNSDDILMHTESINQHIANIATDIGTTKTNVAAIKTILSDSYDAGSKALKVKMQ